MDLNAAVQRAPAFILLSWSSLPSTTSITIFRKLATATSWGTAIATPAASSTQYQDFSVSLNTAYEYKVVRVAGGVTGQGYIRSGIDVPLTDYRGKIVLLVDNSFTSSLSAELTQLTKDLRADGWAVLRSDVSRTASPASVRNTVIAHYNSAPSEVKAVFIVGHVPVPYSGNIAPDGHSEHQGAWPCDGYYGEMNGTWTDASVNNNGAQRAENRNVPGDGKFDQSTFPSPLELQVGRVDMFDMPAFGQNETELLRAYLVKLHAFKVKQWTPTQRGLIFDNLEWVSNPLSASGWRNIAPQVGIANVSAPNIYMGDFNTLVNGQSYLWTYGSGAGGQAMEGSTLTFNGADRLGTTQGYAAMSGGGVFNMSMGSYFGDWDNKNNFLRAPLASGSGLTSCWAGIPAWYFHHMGMGENIGLSTLLTMNNTSTQYTPLTDGWQASMGTTHLGLMGDPSLRQKMVMPPSNLVVSNASGVASFSWNGAPEAVDGYHVYGFNASTGAITRLTTTAVTGTTFSNPAVPFVAGAEYMVRSVKLEIGPSGSYFNLSLGALATASGAATADCLGVMGGTNKVGTPCNDNNACTTNDTWNASCQCVGTSITPNATITPSGSLGFCTGGNVTLNASTGTGYTYVWKRNSTTISGATSSSYLASQAGSYTVTISNGGCSTTSAASTVTVAAAPTATISAGGATTFCTGGSVVLTASAVSGNTYVWRRDGTTISGATSNTYSATIAGSYTVVVTNGGCGASSTAIAVSVTAAPTATLTPAGSTALCTGGSVVLSTPTATGNTYLWKLNGTTISGATSNSYTATQAGSYTVTVTRAGCSASSAAQNVTVGSAPVASLTAAGSTSLCNGGSVVLNTSTGAGNTYVWKQNGITITGATGSSYTANTPGNFTVTVTNGGCVANSAAVNVSLNPAPSAVASSNAGNSTVSVTASSGLAPYAYSWSTSPVQSTATATVSSSGNYVVTVTDARGCTATASTSITLATNGCSGTRTESQNTWGATATTGSPAAYMTSNFATAFPGSTYLTIGCGWRKLRLTTAAAVIDFLPSSGSVAQLPWGTVQNPGSSYSNAFAGELVALKLAVRFDELAPSFNPSSVLLKNMVIANGTFAGWTVAQLISSADAKIGSCSSSYTREQLHAAVSAVNAGYLGGTMNSGYLTCPGPAGMVLAPEDDVIQVLRDEQLDVKVFPNPAHDQATLLISGTQEDAPTLISVYSLSGVLVGTYDQGTVESGLEQRVALDVSNMAPGIYFYKVISGERTAGGRVVVE